MALHLVRHAMPVSRDGWSQPDLLRPLDAQGEKQALAIRDLLRDRGVQRVLSSPFPRCIQTVAPLADALRLDVVEHPALTEDAPYADTWALLQELAGTEAVLCSHSTVIPEVVDRAVQAGARLVGDQEGDQRGSVSTLELDAEGTVTTVTYTPPA